MFGGMSPYPRRIGEGVPDTKAIFDSLAADRGTAFDATNENTVVYIETLATARALASTWRSNERLSKLWQPLRCPESVLERWEKILLLTPKATDSWSARRTQVARRLARWGIGCTKSELEARLTIELGANFGSVEHIGYTLAHVTVPDGSYPFGSVSASQPWSSTTSKILIRLVFTDAMTTAECYDAVGKMYAAIDSILPVYVTVDWYANNNNYSYPVTDGPSAAGFILDTAHNLDAQIFDV